MVGMVYAMAIAASARNTPCIFAGCPWNGQLQDNRWKKQYGLFSSIHDCQTLCDHEQDCSAFASSKSNVEVQCNTF